MKSIICLFSVLILTACGTVKMKETDPENIAPVAREGGGELMISETETDDGVLLQSRKAVPFIDFSSSKDVGDIITYLASDELKGREAGSEGIEKAANYIEEIFKKNGVKPFFDSYKDTISNFSEPAYNVVGVLEGNDPKLKNEVVVIGAHYDHIGLISPKNGDEIANGANDNASGTTTVLELARYFALNKLNKRTVIFALFTAEEKGLLGSKDLAKRLKEKNIDLYTMLNFEMVGVALQDKDYFMYVTGYQSTNLAEVANDYAGEKLIGFLPSAQKMNLFQRSDNYAFHTEFGVPSQTFCTFDFTNFDHYHGVDDEAELMDFDHMALVVNKSIPMVTGIINAPTKEIKYN
ncbi:M20/M25/M40 family metallo-hydrolase [Cellulophaga sp. E16_2]|uniref:Peptidase M28 n=1 Tax=Cellulophaga algicola (strain DSM 14237 / IC166 / ACAM 630) TaxID=688270 RepID=E6XE15_CELAD|nr:MULTISPECIES: M28 family peptidase [Cellulophaga]ADV48081.1 peptidase M28 [Cellulophaga algicola DSM 14237]MBO0590533.1 M20/M25/M40 family metallo-hydrolase [Cellulophaga sp. E16_2]